ncbi:D-xylulose 5-phosphate/D-fructose 6-phosphate phosphoketolase [Piedraia hortae CBS 480.64]|uniref:D-xylulose 5-phosphate/D-fructose 6-phosphate phosphoketolase n=1 Tax=Piedraia hortae CBS 480.64 TaxID=1314780 RepID=A0A6A7CBC7_9PEZI|nr:D-xylulose 5-phosphate/D-fructose 6-phosphate phosphoketolase [Piedraia hortae CBS 480.64]
MADSGKPPSTFTEDQDKWSVYRQTEATLNQEPLSEEECNKLTRYFNATMYICLGMIYLKKNPLLREPLKKDHLKPRLLGHWGSDPGQSFTYIHFNRMVKKYNLDAFVVSGPGHGAPGLLSNFYLEGTYSEVYPDKTENIEGLQKFFHQFSYPGGIGSHMTPEAPGSLHEGGELGYSLSHSFGAVFDHPNTIALTIVGDGESETGPLATSWHSNKFLNPITDGAVLPVLHLNGYKINNPTVLARIPEKELIMLMQGYGWKPYIVSGHNLDELHQAMAATVERCVTEIRTYQKQARDSRKPFRPNWPMIILRTAKGWTAPRKVEGHFVEGFWRAHQVPLTNPVGDPEQLDMLEKWMRSYKPEELFDSDGKLIPELRELPPKGTLRMSANPITNGGQLLKPLKMVNFRDYAIDVSTHGTLNYGSMANFARFLRDVMRDNPTNFRLLGPDETTSNKLDTVYEVTKKVWVNGYLPEDDDGGNLAPAGRVMEMLSEHNVEGWLEGYLLSGRHGMLNSYESFVHIISSMVNQHAKWLEKCNEVSWRSTLSSLNILLSSTVWRQDHNGFTHQDPGFLDVIANKSPEVVRIYLPPDGNCLLSVMDHCLRSSNYVNVVVADKQSHLQYLNMEDAALHCEKGIGIWDWASNDANEEPDLVMACCGDVTTQESLAATALLREHLPQLKIRFVNVVDLFKLIPHQYHPHGLDANEYAQIFTKNKPVVMNFHSYPWLIHRLTYGRAGQEKMHVRGYKEHGNVDTPGVLAIRNEIDRFSIAMLAIDNLSETLGNKGAAVREMLLNRRTRSMNHAFETGLDPEDYTNWTWPKQTKEQSLLSL